MKTIFCKIGKAAVTLALAVLLLYALFSKAARIWYPDEWRISDHVLEGPLLTGIELEGETLIYDYAVTQFNDLESLVAASDRILIGEYSYDGQFTPTEALKGNMGGAFPIHFPNELTITARVLEENTWVNVPLTVPSPLRLRFEAAAQGPKLVFLRFDKSSGYIPVGDPWIADLYTDGRMVTRSRLSGSYETTVTAEGDSEQHRYRKKVVYPNLSRPKTDEFLNDLTVEDIRNAALK